MAVNKLIFADAEKARDSILDSQKQDIAKLYNSWADEIAERAKFYEHKQTASSVYQERQMRELEKQLRATSETISNEVYNSIKENMMTVSSEVVKDAAKWAAEIGVIPKDSPVNAMLTSVPDGVVRRLITGQIYEGGWNLSQRIWGNNEEVLANAYKMVAQGMAQNLPTYQIAKNLEQYVRPEAAKSWNKKIAMRNTKTGEIEYKRIYRASCDYNAQRLARTLVQHSYQQALVAANAKNPFVQEFIWYANGSRPCPLCQDRDGQHFKKDELPLDHPNGMCVMEPVVADDITDQISDWYHADEGTYPDIDEYAKQFGYEGKPFFNDTQEKYLGAYGYGKGNMPTFAEWANTVSNADKGKILAEMGTDWNDPYPYQQLNKYFYANLMHPGTEYVQVQATVFEKPITTAEQYLAKFGAGNSGGDKYQYWLKTLPEDTKAANMSSISQGAHTAFDETMYSAQAKDLALRYDRRRDADSEYRPILDKQWASMTEKEKYSVWEYTQNSNPMNRALSGYSEGWERRNFAGIGNVPLGNENEHYSFDTAAFSSKFSGEDGRHKSFESAVRDLTKAIDRSEFAGGKSAYLVRGSDTDGLAGLLEGKTMSFDQANDLIDQLMRSRAGGKEFKEASSALIGQTFTNNAFTSTGIAKDSGFDGTVRYNIFAPAGTKGIYAEPQSFYGSTVGAQEKIYDPSTSHYTSVGQEAEVILQRGTDFRITGVEKEAGELHISMEVVGQPDYFKTGYERTDNGGASEYKLK